MIASQSYWVVVKLGCQEFVAGVWIGLSSFFIPSQTKLCCLCCLLGAKKGKRGFFISHFFLMQEMLKFFNLKKKKFPKEKKICEGKILNFQEYSIFQMKFSRLTNYLEMN